MLTHQSKTRTHLLSILLCRAAVALALGLTACSRGPAADDDEAKKAAGNTVAEVTVVKVERGEISESLSVSGTIAAVPNQDVRVSSLVAGRVAQMMVAEGDHVEKDQVLAKIDDRPYRDQLRQAEGAVEQARATLENAS